VVHQQVIDDPPVVVTHRGILDAPLPEGPGVVDGDRLQEVERPRAGELHLPHVRDVEDADGAANAHVLLDDSRVLDGHFESPELHDLRPERAVHLVERRPLEACGAPVIRCATGTDR
jgi:hypothetical protein